MNKEANFTNMKIYIEHMVVLSQMLDIRWYAKASLVRHPSSLQ